MRSLSRDSPFVHRQLQIMTGVGLDPDLAVAGQKASLSSVTCIFRTCTDLPPATKRREV